MARSQEHGPPRDARAFSASALVVGAVAIVLVGAAVFALNGGLHGPSPSSSPVPSFAGGQPAPVGSVPAGGSSVAPEISLPPAPDRPIAYSQTAGSPTIWSIEPGGTATQLVKDTSSSGAAWSRDGRQIAFIRQAGKGIAELWVMNGDGSSAHALTTGAGAVERPSWSPSGDRNRVRCKLRHGRHPALGDSIGRR